jgi:hypothetical protein
VAGAGVHCLGAPASKFNRKQMIKRAKNDLLPALLILALFPSCIRATAMDDSTRYQAIAGRNMFRLTASLPVETSVPMQRQIELSGIMTTPDKKIALLVVSRQNAKQPHRFLNLAEGESDGAIEVVEVFKQTGEVKIRDDGMEMTLSLSRYEADSRGDALPAAISPQPLPPPHSNTYWWRMKNSPNNSEM